MTFKKQSYSRKFSYFTVRWRTTVWTRFCLCDTIYLWLDSRVYSYIYERVS